MSAPSTILRCRFLPVLALLAAAVLCARAAPTSSGRGAPALALEGLPEDLVLRDGPDGARVAVWAWGTLVLDGDGPSALRDGDVLTVAGPLDLTTVGEGGDDGPYLFLAPGLALYLDPDARVRVDDGVLRAAAPKADMDPRAAVLMFLGILVLTAVMMRNTRRSLAGR